MQHNIPVVLDSIPHCNYAVCFFACRNMLLRIYYLNKVINRLPYSYIMF